MVCRRPARRPRLAVASAAVLALSIALPSAGCAVIFPEYGTHVAVAPKLENFDPPPPTDRHYIQIEGAEIPARTRDGRLWGDIGGLPDPYVKMFVGEEEILRTDPESNTLTPKWADAPKGNFPLKAGDELRIEVWDNRAIIDHPIGLKTITISADTLSSPEQDLDFDGGLELKFQLAPAKPVWGVGLKYELRTSSAYVTKVLDASPAERAGVKVGDEILKIDGRDVPKMSADDVTGLLTAIPAAGRKITFVHDGGSTLDAVLKEGPIYGLYKDIGDPAKPQ